MTLTAIAILRAVLDSMQSAEEMGGPEGQDYLDLMAAIAKQATERGTTYAQERRGATLQVVWEVDPEPWDRVELASEEAPPFIFRAYVADPTPGAEASLASLCQIGVLSPTDPYLLEVERELLDEASDAIRRKGAPT